MAAKFEIRSPKAGEYRWVLVSQGRTLATSPAYSRRGAAEKAIDSFRMAAIAAPVNDTTVPAAKATTRKAARATGRTLGQAAAKTGRAVVQAEQALVKASKRTATKVAKATGRRKTT
jgi:uncharacterized protein YegP (UPF0339 family)